MSVVSLLGVKVLNNPAHFSSSYQFEITFECLEQLQKDLEWKLTYVGSATSSEQDQELDSLLVGPIPVGVNKFIFEADAPDYKRIPDSEVLGVTVILLTCSYDGREFVRVGYYVNNEYDSEELAADPPAKPQIEHIRRNVLAEKPRVTRFAIKWDSEESAPADNAYGAEERELEAALVKELEEANKGENEGDDHEMEGGGEVTAGNEGEEEEISDGESEDLEEESDDDDDELDEDEAGEGDEDVEMGDDKPSHQPQPEVMVH
ncbi:Histone deposition protein Asf1 [Penicillium cinerascens]|uniref:Histone chaperone n=1 Tax=Penicillium cinerascens TaxID=70096 RepID=A0A9W9T6T2_9EURO|nr:Histone deposition protein Asf1 [Penicillium cinerascens]KAJ5211682.1 Histone deposition protein Asf1 [Penicillium cinerascens]